MSQDLRIVPELFVSVGGTPLTEPTLSKLSCVRVWQRLSMPSLCELEFAVSPEDIRELPEYQPGVKLELSLGGARIGLFRGKVSVIEHSFAASGMPRLRMRGMDCLQELQGRRSTRNFGALNVVGLAQELVAELGLDVVCEESPEVREQLVQWHRSDFEFLVDEAQRAGLYLCLQGNALELVSLAGTGTPIELEWPLQLHSVAIEANAGARTQSYSVTGWNGKTAEAHSATADNPRCAEDQASTNSRLGQASAQDPVLCGESVSSDSEARERAQAKLDALAARAVIVRGVAEGNADLLPGRRVRVLTPSAQGTSSETFCLCEVTHTIDPQVGWRTEFDSTPPAPLEREWESVASLGRVVDIADPDQLGRVRVALDALGEAESLWLSVVLPAAGPDKGLIALPEEGDKVLVLLPQRDPAHALVLGGLYGQAGVPDREAGAGSKRRYSLQTPAGQRFRLDDDEESVRVEIGSGSYVELKPDGVNLHAESDLTLEAPGRRVAIRGARIDFEEA